jgi:hypothetical protein
VDGEFLLVVQTILNELAFLGFGLYPCQGPGSLKRWTALNRSTRRASQKLSAHPSPARHAAIGV